MFCDFHGTRNTRPAKIAKRLAVKNGGQLKRSGAQVEFLSYLYPIPLKNRCGIFLQQYFGCIKMPQHYFFSFPD